MQAGGLLLISNRLTSDDLGARHVSLVHEALNAFHLIRLFSFGLIGFLFERTSLPLHLEGSFIQLVHLFLELLLFSLFVSHFSI